jgi:hypothetical protein
MPKPAAKPPLPCRTCPWRTDQGAETIPNYRHNKACNLINTVGRGDAFRPIMACHGSTDGEPRACRGYLAREGWSNLNVRLLLIRGGIENPSDVAEACERHGVELEPDYPAVLEKLDATKED